LLLNTNSGIFFEFVPLAEIGKTDPQRIPLSDVRIGEQYALIINSNAGLWGYNIGDTVRFVSLDPYRIVVSGRIKHFISAFGEHVIGEEVEAAMQATAAAFGVGITEFTVAPVVSQGEGQSHHEWWIEFREMPADREAFMKHLDQRMREKNVYYDDLIVGNILSPLRIKVVQAGGFIEYMRSVGKLGGQNKVPRLSNDRKLVEGLEPWSINE
jgi:acyl-CoA synthetase (AMP-forming)/AMP-acid ligase II